MDPLPHMRCAAQVSHSPSVLCVLFFVYIVRSRQLHGHRAELLRDPPTLLGGKDHGTAHHQPTSHSATHAGAADPIRHTTHGPQSEANTEASRRPCQSRSRTTLPPRSPTHDAPYMCVPFCMNFGKRWRANRKPRARPRGQVHVRLCINASYVRSDHPEGAGAQPQSACHTHHP